MIDPESVGWGRYSKYSGPMYLGNANGRFTLEKMESFHLGEAGELLYVISRTEGGNLMAYNGYDRCRMTSGLIQFCEAGMYGTSAMLGYAKMLYPDSLKVFDRFLWATVRGQFKRNANGRYRFFVEGEEVDTAEEQQRLFFKNCTGLYKQWDDPSERWAKQWAAAVSSVWEDPQAQKAQIEFSAKRLMGFVIPDVMNIVRDAPPSAEGRAFKAAYLSFAANNPLWASKALKAAEKELAGVTSRYSRDWLLMVLRKLTYHSGITIYPTRYNHIRPILEQFYQIDLPDFAEDLKELDLGGQGMWDPVEVQEALIKIGKDLGPKGADGIWGPKSQEAMLSFQQELGIDSPTPGYPDKRSRAVLIIMKDEIARRVTLEDLATFGQGIGIDLQREIYYNET